MWLLWIFFKVITSRLEAVVVVVMLRCSTTTIVKICENFKWAADRNMCENILFLWASPPHYYNCHHYKKGTDKFKQAPSMTTRWNKSTVDSGRCTSRWDGTGFLQRVPLNPLSCEPRLRLPILATPRTAVTWKGDRLAVRFGGRPQCHSHPFDLSSSLLLSDLYSEEWVPYQGVLQY